MKRKIKAIVAISLVVVIVLGVLIVSLSSDTQKINETLDSNNIISLGNAQNDLSIKDYTLKLENENLQLWMNDDTTEFKVVNKSNGAVWHSTNPDRVDGSIDASPLILSYLNSKGAIEEINFMDGCVSEGKYSIEKNGEKLTVKYSVGDFSELSLVPYALPEDRFQEILNSFEDEFEQMKLIDLYYLTDINIIEDEELKAQRLKDYPLLKKQKLYIIRDSTRIDPIAKKGVAKIFSDAGYTKEDYEKDLKYFSANETVKNAPGFNVAIEYSLKGKSLHVSIPYNNLEMYNEFPLTSITFAPYFGSPKQGTNGWFLLPDGSGSVMNFYNGNTIGKVYRTAVYGQDLAQSSRENLNSDAGASLPVFGINSNGNGVLCEITDGAAISEIVAYAGDTTESSYAHAVFNVRSAYKTSTSTGRKETFMIVQKPRYTGDIALDYHFIDSKNATLADMASIVRKNIFGDAKSDVSDSIPVMLTQVGLITRKNQFLGVSYNEKVELTNFDQSLEMVNNFLDSGVNDLSVTLTGWFGDGVNHKFLTGKTSPSKLLGGKKAFLSLLEGINAKNVPFYIDGDIQYTGKTALFDGFKKNSDTVTMLDQSTGRNAMYNPASFIRTFSQFSYINNLEAQKEGIEALKTVADNYSIKGISLRTVGSELVGDYGNPTVDRQAMANAIGEQLRGLKESGYKVTTKGANAYALPYISKVTDVPVVSSGSDTTDMSVPFLQMVLSGNVDYYAPAINLSGDVKTALLRAVSSGSGLSYVLTAQNGEKITGSDQSSLYSTSYDYWKEDLVKQIADAQKRLSSVAGRKIVGYEQLAQGVYKTVYDNGVEVVVNYNDKPFTYTGITVNSKDFSVKGVRS